MRWPARWRRPVRVLGDVTLLAVLGYAAVLAYLYAYQVDLIFRPPPTGALYTASLDIAPERVIVAGPDGLSTVAWRVRAAGADSCGARPYWELFLHGNAAAISSSPNVRRFDQLRGLGL